MFASIVIVHRRMTHFKKPTFAFSYCSIMKYENYFVFGLLK